MSARSTRSLARPWLPCKKVRAQIAQIKLEDGLPTQSRVVIKSRSTPTHIDLALCGSEAKGDWHTDAFNVGNPDVVIRVHRSVLNRVLANAQLREQFAPALGIAFAGKLSSKASTTSSALQKAPSRWSLEGNWLMLEFADMSQPQSKVAIASAEGVDVSR